MKRVLISVLFTAATCIGLQAQSQPVTAKIPFEFQAGKQAMPPGDYQVRFANGFVTIRERDTGSYATSVMSNAAYSASALDHAKLIFVRYGDRYFLRSVWDGQSDYGRELLQTPVEKELAKNFGTSGKTAILALTNKK